MIFIRYVLLIGLLFINFSTLSFADEFMLVLQGSNTIGAKLTPQLAKQFMINKGYRNVGILPGSIDNEYIVSGQKTDESGLQMARIKISAHGSGTGFVALQQHDADIAMSSRPIKPQEIESLKAIGNMRVAWVEHAIAIDGLAILTNRDNSVKALTIAQVAQIFSGKINNWKMVGGKDSAIHRYARDDKSGTWDTFRELVFSQDDVLDNTTLRFESSDQLSDRVANDSAGIGFSGLSSVHNAQLLAIADEGTEAMQPGKFSVATEDYPLSRRLYLYSPTYLKNTAVREFIEFCQSEAGQKIVAEIGFVSQDIQPYAFAVVDSNAPEQYRQLSQQAQRLSLNFRFDEGSPRLDNKAYRDLDRLINYLQKQENQGVKVYLAGFSDARNNPVLDMVLSRFRALAVKSVLMEEGLAVEEIQALGSYNPIISNQKGAIKNRNGRVEVWVEGASVNQVDIVDR